MSNVYSIPFKNVSEEKFFEIWVTLLSPFTKLSLLENKLLQRLLYENYVISKSVKDNKLVGILLFSSETRNKIRVELQLTNISFNNTLASLRKKNIIIENNISNSMIPVVDFSKGTFSINFNIEFNEEE